MRSAANSPVSLSQLLHGGEEVGKSGQGNAVSFQVNSTSKSGDSQATTVQLNSTNQGRFDGKRNGNFRWKFKSKR